MNALQQKVEKNQPSGYPGLDSAGFILSTQIPAIPNGSLPARLGTGGAAAGGDLNTVVQNGWYTVAPNTTNAPTTSWWLLHVVAMGASDVYQFAYADTAQATGYVRTYIGGSWSGWWQFLGKALTVGAAQYVGQLDAGHIGLYDNGWGLVLDGSQGKVWFGAWGTLDTNLYRQSAGILRTDQIFQALGGVSVVRPSTYDWAFWSQEAGDANPRWRVVGWGAMDWGDGTNAPDANLYRQGVNLLQTDSTLYVKGRLAASLNDPGQVYLGNIGPGATAGILFGNAQDTSLWRSNANALNMNGQFAAAYEVYARNGDATYQTYMGYMPIPSYGGAGAGIKLNDSTFVRYGAKFVMTDAQFWAMSTLASVQGGDGWPRVALNNNSSIQFGPGNAGVDVTLIRNAAAELALQGNYTLTKPDGSRSLLLWRDYTAPNQPGLLLYTSSGGNAVELSAYNGPGGTQPGLRFKGDQYAVLYSPAAATVKTDGKMDAAQGFFVNGVPIGGGGDSAWASLSLASGWVWGNSAYSPPRYRKLSNGMVNVQGFLQWTGGGTQPSATQLIATLPAGYRPAYNIPTQNVAAGNVYGTSCRIDVRSDGTINYTQGDNVNNFMQMNILFFAEA